MIEIGERAGVSQATVSLVLNRVPNARVAEATRIRVLEAADALGYRKGPQHHVPENKTRVIGLLLDEVTTTPFATPFIEGAREEAALQDVVVATFSTRSDPKLESLALDMLLSSQVIGVLYASLVTRPVEVPERLRDVPTAQRAISSCGSTTVESGGFMYILVSSSSKPTTDISSGTRSPRERNAS